jgi:hypothetical protein
LELGYDGDSSDDNISHSKDFLGVWAKKEFGGLAHPNFWLIMEVSNGQVTTYFHCRYKFQILLVSNLMFLAQGRWKGRQQVQGGSKPSGHQHSGHVQTGESNGAAAEFARHQELRRFARAGLVQGRLGEFKEQKQLIQRYKIGKLKLKIMIWCR